MKTTEKQWGESRELVSNQQVEVHSITIRPGGHCSWHHHERKVNEFVIVSGTLIIEWSTAKTWADHTWRDHFMTTLRKGESMAVPAGRIHRFVNKSGAPVEALEVYYPEVLGVDIVRHSTGGIL